MASFNSGTNLILGCRVLKEDWNIFSASVTFWRPRAPHWSSFPGLWRLRWLWRAYIVMCSNKFTQCGSTLLYVYYALILRCLIETLISSEAQLEIKTYLRIWTSSSSCTAHAHSLSLSLYDVGGDKFQPLTHTLSSGSSQQKQKSTINQLLNLKVRGRAWMTCGL